MKLLELRKKMKSRKPDFIRQDAHKKLRLGKKWRKPRGLHSKIKNRMKGYSSPISIGWKSPRKVRGLSQTGLIPILVASINQLNGIDKEKQGIIIAKSVGNKKRVDIINKAQELNLKILNMKDPVKYMENIKEDFEKRKQDKKKKTEERQKKKKEIEKKAEEKKKENKEELTEKIAEEEKKKQEKKEKDKILTKKE